MRIPTKHVPSMKLQEVHPFNIFDKIYCTAALKLQIVTFKHAVVTP